MLRRFLSATLTVGVLLAGTLPAYAQGPNPAVYDRSGGVYDVNATRARIPNLIPGPDAERINTLQMGRLRIVPVSPVSPDDGAVLVNAEGTYAIADLAGDISAVVDLDDLQYFYGTDQFVWLNNTTLAQFGYLQTIDEQGRQVDIPQLLTIDRATGAAQLLGRPAFGPELTPISIAPQASKLLLAGPAAGDQIPGVQALARRHDPDGEDVAALPRWRQDQLKVLTTNSPTLARRAALVDLFSPAPGELRQLQTDATLYSLDLNTGAIQALLTLPAGTTVDGMAWSQDGSRLALSYTALPLTRQGRDGARISESIYMDSVGSIAPALNPFLQQNSVVAFELNKGAQQRIKPAINDGTTFGDVQWSSDGSTLMVQHRHATRLAGRSHPTYNPSFASRGSFRFYDSTLRELRRLETPALSSVDSTVTYGQFVSPDEVIFSAHSGTDTHPWYFNLRSGELRKIASQPGTYAGITATSSRTRQIVYFYDSFTEPGELYRTGWDGTGPTALTGFNEELRQLSRTRQHPVSFTLRNGQTRTGVLILPADVPFPPKGQRIVAWQEGGPTVSVQNSWSATVESPFALLPNFGIGVLVTPLYGRYGLDPQRFATLASGTNFGQVDIDEQAEIVRQLTAQGWAQPGQVGIAGCSYGGYFVAQSLVRHPDLYGAGNAMCSLVDVYTEWSRGYDSLMPWLQGLPPYVGTEEYRKDSPLFNAAAVRTPLLTFHGKEDFLPVTVMENFHAQLVNRQVPARMLRFEGVGHGFGQEFSGVAEGLPRLYESYELYGAQEQLLWFQTHLK